MNAYGGVSQIRGIDPQTGGTDPPDLKKEVVTNTFLSLDSFDHPAQLTSLAPTNDTETPTAPVIAKPLKKVPEYKDVSPFLPVDCDPLTSSPQPTTPYSRNDSFLTDSFYNVEFHDCSSLPYGLTGSSLCSLLYFKILTVTEHLIFLPNDKFGKV